MTTGTRKARRVSGRESEHYGEAPYLSLPAGPGEHHPPSATPAASGELPLGLMVRRVHLAIARGLNQALRERSVTPAQWVFLRMLWAEDGLNQKELADRVGIHPTTAVPALDILTRNGYITRVRSEADKRNVAICLTGKGRKLANELLPIAMAQNRTAFGGMSERDAEKLMRLLHKVLINLEGLAPAEEPDD